jgi:hypothetical protein
MLYLLVFRTEAIPYGSVAIDMAGMSAVSYVGGGGIGGEV